MSIWYMLGVLILVIISLCFCMKKQGKTEQQLKEAEDREELHKEYEDIDSEFNTIDLDSARDRMREKVDKLS